MNRFAAVTLALALAACGKSEDPGSSAPHDYSKPMLTEQNVGSLVKCINENPKVGQFMYGGGQKGLAEFQEFEAIVKKYGFAGRMEFLNAKSHCDAAEDYLRECDMADQMIAKWEAELKKPNLDEDSRNSAQGQISRWTQQKASVSKRAPDADIDVIRKQRAAFQAADKKAKGP